MSSVFTRPFLKYIFFPIDLYSLQLSFVVTNIFFMISFFFFLSDLAGEMCKVSFTLCEEQPSICFCKGRPHCIHAEGGLGSLAAIFRHGNIRNTSDYEFDTLLTTTIHSGKKFIYLFFLSSNIVICQRMHSKIHPRQKKPNMFPKFTTFPVSSPI